MPSVLRLSAALLLLLAVTAAYAANDRTFDRQLPAQPRGAVDVSNVSGKVEVSGWDRSEVSVHAELGAAVDRVEVSSEGGHTGIKVILPHSSVNGGGDARVQVKIPKDSELNVSAVSADVTTQGVLGVQRLNTVSGDIAAEVGGADVELKTVSGNLKVQGHGQPARLRLSTVSGDVHLEHGAGDVEASSVNGTLIVSLDSTRSLRAHTTSGNVRFAGKLGPGAELEATTVSGNLEVRASGDGGFTYEVSSFSGNIRDCFNASAEHTSKYVPGTHLDGKRGEGAGHVRLKTMSGDVQLCDRL